MPNKRRQKKRHPRRSNRGKNQSTYDTVGKASATRGSGNAFKDAKSHLPILGNQYEDRKMLYYEYQVPLIGASGILDTHYFSANGVYDPDATGTGHQPIGFDQAMLFYEQYVVFQSTITVTFYSNITGTGVRCGIFLNPDTVNPTIGAIMENGYMKSTAVRGTDTAGFHNLHTVSLNCSSVRYFDSKTRANHAMRDSFSGTAAANPTEQVYFGLFAFNFVSATSYEVYCDVMISYDVRFWEPRKISQSLFHQTLSVVLKTTASKEEEEKKKTSIKKK